MYNKLSKKENIETVFELLSNDKEKLLNLLVDHNNLNDPDKKDIRNTNEYKKTLSKILDNEENMFERLKFLGSESNFKMDSIIDYLESLEDDKKEKIVKSYLFLK